MALLAVSVAMSAGLCVYYLSALHTARLAQYRAQRLQSEVVIANRNRAVIQSLAAEAMDYGKRNAAIEPVLSRYTPLLQQLGLKPGAPAPTRPGGR